MERYQLADRFPRVADPETVISEGVNLLLDTIEATSETDPGNVAATHLAVGMARICDSYANGVMDTDQTLEALSELHWQHRQQSIGHDAGVISAVIPRRFGEAVGLKPDEVSKTFSYAGETIGREVYI